MADLLNLLTDIEGVAVGHCTDLALGSGVTAIIFDEPAVASCSVLGGAPGGRDTALLDPAMTVGVVDGLVLSGGSAFGLDAAGGVQAGLRDIGRGLQVGTVRVPLVPQAILFDLINGGNKDWGLHSPYRDMGYAAFTAAGKGPSRSARPALARVRRQQRSRADSARPAPSAAEDIGSRPSLPSTRWVRRPSARDRISGPHPSRSAANSAALACPKPSTRASG